MRPEPEHMEHRRLPLLHSPSIRASLFLPPPLPPNTHTATTSVMNVDDVADDCICTVSDVAVLRLCQHGA